LPPLYKVIFQSGLNRAIWEEHTTYAFLYTKITAEKGAYFVYPVGSAHNSIVAVSNFSYKFAGYKRNFALEDPVMQVFSKVRTFELYAKERIGSLEELCTRMNRDNAGRVAFIFSPSPRFDATFNLMRARIHETTQDVFEIFEPVIAQDVSFDIADLDDADDIQEEEDFIPFDDVPVHVPPPVGRPKKQPSHVPPSISDQFATAVTKVVAPPPSFPKVQDTRDRKKDTNFAQEKKMVYVPKKPDLVQKKEEKIVSFVLSDEERQLLALKEKKKKKKLAEDEAASLSDPDKEGDGDIDTINFAFDS